MASFQGREEAAERSPAEGLVLGLDSFSIFKDNLKSQACSDTMFWVGTRHKQGNTKSSDLAKK